MGETGANGPTSEETGGEIVEDEIQSKKLDQEKEFELTSEIEEKVMEKVQDIYKEGTAFCYLRSSIPKTASIKDDKSSIVEPIDEVRKNILNVLTQGLLGSNSPVYQGRTYEDIGFKNRVDMWHYYARKYHNPMVFFNIVGRSAFLTSPKGKNVFESDYSRLGGIGLIFDLSQWKETSAEFAEKVLVDNGQQEHDKGFPGQSHTFRIDDWTLYHSGKLINKSPDEIKKLDVSAEYGFVAYHRIAPRYFKGLIVRRVNDQDGLETEFHTLNVSYLVQSQLRAYKDNSQLINPVYDSAGNLLWPKQMSYGEVKQFVAEREAKKQA